MDICLLCTEQTHPVVVRLQEWVEMMTLQGHSVSLIYDKKFLTHGDILFLVSCGQIINQEERKKYKSCLILHASDLPKNRGWSPHIWSILEGENHITVSLLEANDSVDTGDIWLKSSFELDGDEMLPEINEKLFATELTLMTRAVENIDAITAFPQQITEVKKNEPALRKRTPADSRLDPEKTIAEQFELLRVVDNQRYPAFFDYRGKRYVLNIKKYDHE